MTSQSKREATAYALLNTLYRLAEKQNELSERVESLEDEIKHMKLEGIREK